MYAVSLALCFLAGFVLGDIFRKLQWKMLPWKVLKWHDGSFGYRVVSSNELLLARDEKAYLALPIDTTDIDPGDPIKLFRE